MAEEPATPPEDTHGEPENTQEQPERGRWLSVLVIAIVVASVYAIALFLTGRGDTVPSPVSSSTATVAIAPGFRPMSVAFFDEAHGLISGSASCPTCPDRRGGIIASTSDGGKTWSVRFRGERPLLGLTRIGRTNDVWATATVCDNESFIGCRLFRIHSPDLGQTWHADEPRDPFAVSPPATARSCQRDHPYPISSSFVTVSRGWMLCAMDPVSSTYQFKGVFETGSGGKNWAPRAHFHPRLGGVTNTGNLPVDGFAGGISFLRGGTGWLWTVGPHSNLSASTDSGRNWTSLWSPSDSSDGQIVSASLVSTTVGYVVVTSPKTGDALLVTHDGGKDWEPVQSWPAPS